MTVYPEGCFAAVRGEDGRWQIVDQGAVWFASHDEKGVRSMVDAMNHAYRMGFAARDALAAMQGGNDARSNRP